MPIYTLSSQYNPRILQGTHGAVVEKEESRGSNAAEDQQEQLDHHHIDAYLKMTQV